MVVSRSKNIQFCQKNVILCDSWYVKQNLVSIVEEYPNLDLIGNARSDSVIYDLRDKRSLSLCDISQQGRRNQTFVFQHGFSKPATVFCAWQEKAPLNQTGSSQMQYISLFLYSFRWNIMPISALYSLCRHFFNTDIFRYML